MKLSQPQRSSSHKTLWELWDNSLYRARLNTYSFFWHGLVKTSESLSASPCCSTHNMLHYCSIVWFHQKEDPFLLSLTRRNDATASSHHTIFGVQHSSAVEDIGMCSIFWNHFRIQRTARRMYLDVDFANSAFCMAAHEELCPSTRKRTRTELAPRTVVSCVLTESEPIELF